MDDETYRRPAYALQSVDNALRLIQLLRDSGEARLSDIARDLDVSPAAAHRLLAMLVYRGFATHDDRGYSPGPALDVGPTRTTWPRRLRGLLAPHLELLTSRVDETTNLMIRVGTWVRFLDSVEPGRPGHLEGRVGTVLDAHRASGGLALLAGLDRAELDELYRSAPARITGGHLDDAAFAALLDELATVRRTGHALNRGETEPGVWAVGTALRGPDGVAVAAFAVSAPRARRRELLAERTLAVIGAAREEMERSLREAGFRTA